MGGKKKRNKAKSWEELRTVYGEYKVRTVSLDEALGQMFGGCDCDQEEDEIQIESWLMNKIDKAGLFSELMYAERAAGADGVLKFMNINSLADKGGYRDTRKEG